MSGLLSRFYYLLVYYKFHNDKYCPNKYKYDHSYLNIDDALRACIADCECGFVYDWRCNGKVDVHNINLCRVFPATELISNHPDCVYEKRTEGIVCKFQYILVKRI